METFTIESNGGDSSIHDISGACDRVIKFPKNAKFAVVLADFYGGKGYTTHKTEGSAIAKAKELQDYSLEIIDIEGREYYNYYNDFLILKEGN